jgi:hypothetical protein
MLIVLNKQIDEFDEKVNNARRGVVERAASQGAWSPTTRERASTRTATGIQ